MTDILVKARIKTGRKADLAAHLAGGRLAVGNPYEDAIQSSLRDGHGVANDLDAYFVFPAPGAELPEEARRVLEGYFVIDREVPAERVAPGDLARIESMPRLPEWLGIDRDGWRND